MYKVLKSIVAVSVLSVSSIVSAQSITAISPSVQELTQYRQEMSKINTAADLCLKQTWDTHVQFHEKYKVSKYYGDRHPEWGKRSKRLEVIRDVGSPLWIVDQQEPISCIGLTLKCLGEAFVSAQNPVVTKLWNKIQTHVIANGTQGDFLIRDLQTLGWKVMYWNPNPSLNKVWDAEDPIVLKANKIVNWESPVKDELGRNLFNSGWGFHAYRYNSVMKKNDYVGVRVDDKETLVNFGTLVPEKFKQAPFFVGIAHAGYHVFSGSYGQVIEAHSMRHLTSIDNLQRADFNPLAGLAPKWTQSEKYRSGIIAVPPEM